MINLSTLEELKPNLWNVGDGKVFSRFVAAAMQKHQLWSHGPGYLSRDGNYYVGVDGSESDKDGMLFPEGLSKAKQLRTEDVWMCIVMAEASIAFNGYKRAIRRVREAGRP